MNDWKALLKIEIKIKLLDHFQILVIEPPWGVCGCEIEVAGLLGGGDIGVVLDDPTVTKRA